MKNGKRSSTCLAWQTRFKWCYVYHLKVVTSFLSVAFKDKFFNSWWNSPPNEVWSLPYLGESWWTLRPLSTLTFYYDLILTLQVLSSPTQQVVENVERSLFFGLTYCSRFLQEIFIQLRKDGQGLFISTQFYTYKIWHQFPRILAPFQLHKTTSKQVSCLKSLTETVFRNRGSLLCILSKLLPVLILTCHLSTKRGNSPLQTFFKICKGSRLAWVYKGKSLAVHLC